MKIRNLFVMLLLGGSLIFSGSVFTGCASWSNTGKGAAIGAGSGAALGAGIGALAGKGCYFPLALPFIFLFAILYQRLIDFSFEIGRASCRERV